ncbi:threonine-phosphate decarboxylase CobD [Shewanella sp. 125m-7]
MSLLHHGGRLKDVAKRYGVDETSWLDLSTGVSPWHYPIPDIPVSCWNRLPEDEDGLIASADRYYGGRNALPVAGSQAAIQCLPKVLAAQRGGAGVVLLPRVGYKEHERAWRMHGWKIEYYGADNDDMPIEVYQPRAEQLKRCDVLLVINPNNPAAHLTPRTVLISWLERLSARDAILVVDEAFMDMTPEQSMLPLTNDNLIVLRSVGKFFGLAGVRAGFIYAANEIRDALQTQLGPWCLNGPAREVCKAAFDDIGWHQRQKKRLHASSIRLQELLLFLPGKAVGTDLFQTIYLTNAPLWHDHLCGQNILTRLTDEQDALRFGLPADEEQWIQLTFALQALALSNAADIARERDRGSL